MTTRFTRGQSCIVCHTRFSICYSAQSKHKTQFIIIAHQSNIAFESLHKTSSVGKVALFHVGAHNSTNYLCKLLQTIVTRVWYSLAELLSVSGGKLPISISTQPENMLVVFRLQTNWWNQPYLHDCTQAIGFVFAFFCSVGNNVLLTPIQNWRILVKCFRKTFFLLPSKLLWLRRTTQYQHLGIAQIVTYM